MQLSISTHLLSRTSDRNIAPLSATKGKYSETKLDEGTYAAYLSVICWALILGMLAIAISACGSAIIATNVGASAQFSPAPVDFGDVDVGSSATAAVSLTNSAESVMQVSSVSVAGTGFALISSEPQPENIAAGGTKAFTLSFFPTDETDYVGTIVAMASSGQTLATAQIHGHGRYRKALTVNPAKLEFGSVAVGTTASQTITLTSRGHSSIAIDSIASSNAAFAVNGPGLPVVLPPGESVAFQVSFSPADDGVVVGSISITTDSAFSSVVAVPLGGVGMGPSAMPALSVNSTSLNFGSVQLGSKVTRPVIFSSVGSAPLTISSVGVSGAGFSYSGATFPVTLNPGMSLTLEMQFEPATTGDAAGSLIISSDSGAGGPMTVSLSGVGVAPSLSVSASSVNFGNDPVGNAAAKSVTLSSLGTSPVTISSATISGPGFSYYGVSFPTTLIPGASLTIQIGFDPSVAGNASGSLVISSNATGGGSTIAIQLNGTGVAPVLSVSTSSLNFGSDPVGTAVTKPVILASVGTSPLAIDSGTVTGAGFFYYGASFPVILNPGATLTLEVEFDPSAAGNSSGSLAINSNSSAGSPVTIQLTGIGTSTSTGPILSVSSTGIDFGSDPVGTPILQSLTLSSTGSSAVTISSANIVGAGFSFSGATFPVSLNPGAALPIQVQFDPTASGAGSGTLTFVSNSSNGTTTTVNLSGAGTAVTHEVALSWIAPESSPLPVVGYNIYRTAGSNPSYQLLNPTVDSQNSYVDTNVQSGTTYTYYVTSVDGSGTESTPSNSVTLAIP